MELDPGTECRSTDPKRRLQQLREVFRDEDAMGGGTIFKAITKADLHAVLIVQPNRALSERADSLFEALDGLIRVLTFSARNLRSIRDLLLPKLVTGEIDASSLDLDALLEETPV